MGEVPGTQNPSETGSFFPLEYSSGWKRHFAYAQGLSLLNGRGTSAQLESRAALEQHVNLTLPQSPTEILYTLARKTARFPVQSKLQCCGVTFAHVFRHLGSSRGAFGPGLSHAVFHPRKHRKARPEQEQLSRYVNGKKTVDGSGQRGKRANLHLRESNSFVYCWRRRARGPAKLQEHLKWGRKGEGASLSC